MKQQVADLLFSYKKLFQFQNTAMFIPTNWIASGIQRLCEI